MVRFNLELQHSAMHSFLHEEHCVWCQISKRCTNGCVYEHLSGYPYHAATGQTIFINDTSGGSTGRLADQSGTSHITQRIAATNVNVNGSVLTIIKGSGCVSTDKLWKH